MQELPNNVTFRSSDGVEVRGVLTRISRHAAVFEVPDPFAGLRLSEVLPDFSANVSGGSVYGGRAVVRNQINLGGNLICEVTLNDDCWRHVDFALIKSNGGNWADEYRSFLDGWQKLYKIIPEYKLVVADMQTYFTDLRFWLSQLELGLSPDSDRERQSLEENLARQLSEVIVPTIDNLFDKFEDVALRLKDEIAAAHQNYMRRQLHSLVLAAPFAYRTFAKPLGYAGDYEMVNMILRNAPEGDSLFGMVLHTWFVQQQPAQAHRNRIEYLVKKISDAILQAGLTGRGARIFNMACGPASEVESFIVNSSLRDRAEFTLLDFNEETLKYTRMRLENASAGKGRLPPVQFIKKSVHHLLKEGGKKGIDANQARYDLVYCAGLFDYLSDDVCQRLLDVMYNWVSPGGLLVATNVEPGNPRRLGMDHLLDWPLIYRTAPQMSRLRPKAAHPQSAAVFSDDTGVNVFLEVRKPQHG